MHGNAPLKPQQFSLTNGQENYASSISFSFDVLGEQML
jgi:hypothetical protein